MNNNNNNNRSQEQINRIINNLTQQLNSKQQKSEPKQSQVDQLLKGLNEKQADKVKNILNDPQKAQKILESPQAQALIKKFGDKNQ